MLVEGSDDDSQGEQAPYGGEDELEVELKTLQISLNSLKGLTSNKSFKVEGSLGGTEVIILVDTRATNNFISKGLVQQLNLTIDNTPQYLVEVGSGQTEKGQGICRGVDI